MTSPQHFLALRPCIELLTLGSDGRLIPATGAASNLGILRLGEHIEIRPGPPTSSTTSFFLLLSSGGLIVYLLYKSLNDENQSSVEAAAAQQPSRTLPASDSSQPSVSISTGQRWSAQNWLRWLLFGDTSDLRGQYFGPIQPGPVPSSNETSAPLVHARSPCRSKVNNMKQMSQIVYVSPCPNCVRGVCKIKKHHQLLYHRHQFVPILESASTSGSSTPNRLQMLENGQNSHKSASPRHHSASTNQKQSKTADCSADDESSEDDGSRIIKESPSRRKKSCRVPPEGRDASLRNSSIASKSGHDQTCPNKSNQQSLTMARDDESMDSIVGMTGSMVDLVKGAREVRRLIREASFDSLASEFSLDFQDGLGGRTASHFDTIDDEISKLKDNFETMNESIEFKCQENASESLMKSSKSHTDGQGFSTKESTPAMQSLSSSPDLRSLHKIIHSAPRNKALWTLTPGLNVFSDNDSNCSPIHRDTSASPMLRDARDPKYKVVLSSNASECGGDWEWDSEGLSADFGHADFVPEHETWLQDDVMELDLEAELLASTFDKRRDFSSQSSACGSDLDSSFYSKVRLPPSGRSSVLSNQHEAHQNISADFKSVMSLNFSRSSSTNSLKNIQDNSPSYRSPAYYYNKGPQSWDASLRKTSNRSSKSYSSSDESGIEDKSLLTGSDFSMTSSKTSVTTPLSPVHEVKESPSKSLEMDVRKGQKARRRAVPPPQFQLPN